MKKKITIKDVALAAGCSTATASIAFTGRGRISPATKSRVFEEADRLGYTPNRAAQMLSRKTPQIAVVMPDTPTEVQSLLMQGIEIGLEKDANPAVCNFITYNYDIQSILNALNQVDNSASGLIIEMRDYTIPEINAELQRIEALSIPIVKLVVGPKILSEKCLISINAETIGCIAAELLSLYGCKNCALISGEKDSEIHIRVYDSFKKALEEHGMSLSSYIPTNDDPSLVGRKVEDLISGDHIPDGIFVSSYFAYAVRDALGQSALQKDIPIIGVDLHEKNTRLLADRGLVAIISQNQKLQGERAVRILLREIMHQSNPDKKLYIKPEIVLNSNLHLYTE